MNGEKAKMLSGDLYDPSDPTLVAEREQARALTRWYNGTSADESGTRRRILGELLGATGDRLRVEPPFRCDYGSNVHVGDDVYLNVGCVFLDVRRVTLGDSCLLGPGVHVYTATHPLDPAERASGLEYGEPVALGDDVWVGGQAVVTPGVTVGDAAVVGAGAVVTDDVPAGVVVAGNPARVVRELDVDED
jgi:maltose O-acetyltransferase